MQLQSKLLAKPVGLESYRWQSSINLMTPKPQAFQLHHTSFILAICFFHISRFSAPGSDIQSQSNKLLSTLPPKILPHSAPITSHHQSLMHLWNQFIFSSLNSISKVRLQNRCWATVLLRVGRGYSSAAEWNGTTGTAPNSSTGEFCSWHLFFVLWQMRATLYRESNSPPTPH